MLDAVKLAKPGSLAEQARKGYDVWSGRRYASMKIRDVIRAVEADGWREKRTRGSHRQFKHPTKPGKVTIAGKLGDDIPADTLSSILRQAGLSRKDLR